MLTPDRGRRTLSKALPCAIALLLLLMPLVANAATITIYGKGGVQLIPPALCPKESSSACATIELDTASPNPNEWLVYPVVGFEVYRAVLDPIDPEITEMQGSELVIHSMTQE